MPQEKPVDLVITRVRQQAPEIRSFDMKPIGADDSRDIAFVPGQVAVLQIQNERPAYFAFASSPDDTELEFLIKRKSGASNTLFEMSEGDSLSLVDVVGHGFSLDLQKSKDLVFVAMGTGVAPLRSALRYALGHREEFGAIVVLYGVRTPDDFCYRDETGIWEAAGVELRQVISRPDGHDWTGPTGYVQSLLDHVLPLLPDPVALVCGSSDMIDQTREQLIQMGFTGDHVLTNY